MRCCLWPRVHADSSYRPNFQSVVCISILVTSDKRRCVMGLSEGRALQRPQFHITYVVNSDSVQHVQKILL